MKLLNKVLIATGSTWLVFLVAVYVGSRLPFFSNLATLLVLSVLFSVLMMAFLRVIIIKHLEHFDHNVTNLEAHEDIQLETALRKAINNHEFVLYYQPKINLQNGTISAVEALIRWESPELGMISPSIFIPLAEETGLIMQIGEWALREACKANKSWQNLGYRPISVAVNLSPKQFRHQDLSQLIATVLSETGLEAKYLELEITETAVMDNVEAAVSKLHEIHKMGVSIAVDDFGTGYTSISYLKQFPINVIKIDQSFVKGIPQNQDDVAITSAVIALAHNLGIKVVAEGVETAEQLQCLADHQCDWVQGYFLSKPLSEKKMIKQLAEIHDMPAPLPLCER